MRAECGCRQTALARTPDESDIHRDGQEGNATNPETKSGTCDPLS